VRNSTNTQQYIEGIDYRLFTTGSVTSIQRLIGGNIGDGETLFVDYRYETSGTAEYDSLESGAHLGIGVGRSLSAHVRYDAFDTDVLSGELINRVNNRERVELGLSLRNRALDGVTVNAQYRHVQQKEDIGPFVSDSFDISMAKNFWGRLRVSLSAAYAKADYETSDEDTDQKTFTIGIGGSPVSRTSVNYDVSYLEDSGGTLERTQVRHRLSFQWSYRLMRANLYAQFSDDELGTTARTDNRITLQVSRYF
jgi:hypothetical protein